MPGPNGHLDAPSPSLPSNSLGRLKQSFLVPCLAGTGAASSPFTQPEKAARGGVLASISVFFSATGTFDPDFGFVVLTVACDQKTSSGAEMFVCIKVTASCD